MAESDTQERFQKWLNGYRQGLQYYLDKSTPLIAYRWTALVATLLVYGIRVYLLEGFYIVTYGLGIFNLNLLLGFLSPQVDPESEGMELPTTSSDEFKPFVRRLPEFKFWQKIILKDALNLFCRYACIKSLLIGFIMTFFPVFDIPVFWPILLIYWIVLFCVTMKRQIQHMIKYRYLPFSFGKKANNHHRNGIIIS